MKQLRYEREIPEEQPLGDTYDIYDLVSKVHSDIPEITRDFTLSDLNEEVLHAKLPKFIRDQLKVIRIIDDYLSIPDEPVYETKEYEEENEIDGTVLIQEKILTGYKISRELQKENNKLKRLLLNEIYSLVIMSRAKGGKILLAMLTHGRTRTEVDELAGQTGEGRTMTEKMFEERTAKELGKKK